MLPPFPESIVPMLIGFFLGGLGYLFVRLLIASIEDKTILTDVKTNCERRMGFWRSPHTQQRVDLSSIEICVVSL